MIFGVSMHHFVIQKWHTFTFSFHLTYTHFRIPIVLIFWNSEYVFKSQRQLESSGRILRLGTVKGEITHPSHQGNWLPWSQGLKILQTFLDQPVVGTVLVRVLQSNIYNVTIGIGYSNIIYIALENPD